MSSDVHRRCFDIARTAAGDYGPLAADVLTCTEVLEGVRCAAGAVHDAARTRAAALVSECRASMISIIIPALDEEKALPATLARLADQTCEREVIVVDGGSSDATCTIAEAIPGVQLLRAPRGRAVQMNAGARAARGDWLLFLHADTWLPPGGLASIASLPIEVDAGCFQQRFSGDDWRLRLVSWLHNLRCRQTGVMYGDQAMFVRRTLFDRLVVFPRSRFSRTSCSAKGYSPPRDRSSSRPRS